MTATPVPASARRPICASGSSTAGYRLVYTPDAVVEHVAGPYAKGQRFDLRYAYWGQKNHLILLIRNFGLTSAIVRAYLAPPRCVGGRRRRRPTG